MADWTTLIELYNIKESMIDHRDDDEVADVRTSGWVSWYERRAWILTTPNFRGSWWIDGWADRIGLLVTVVGLGVEGIFDQVLEEYGALDVGRCVRFLLLLVACCSVACCLFLLAMRKRVSIWSTCCFSFGVILIIFITCMKNVDYEGISRLQKSCTEE